MNWINDDTSNDYCQIENEENYNNSSCLINKRTITLLGKRLNRTTNGKKGIILKRSKRRKIFEDENDYYIFY